MNAIYILYHDNVYAIIYNMDESEIQLKRRENEERATAERARILGLPYLDTRDFEKEIPLTMDLIDVSEMHKDYIIPLWIFS